MSERTRRRGCGRRRSRSRLRRCAPLRASRSRPFISNMRARPRRFTIISSGRSVPSSWLRRGVDLGRVWLRIRNRFPGPGRARTERRTREVEALRRCPKFERDVPPSAPRQASRARGEAGSAAVHDRGVRGMRILSSWQRSPNRHRRPRSLDVRSKRSGWPSTRSRRHRSKPTKPGTSSSADRPVLFVSRRCNPVFPGMRRQLMTPAGG